MVIIGWNSSYKCTRSGQQSSRTIRTAYHATSKNSPRFRIRTMHQALMRSSSSSTRPTLAHYTVFYRQQLTIVRNRSSHFEVQQLFDLAPVSHSKPLVHTYKIFNISPPCQTTTQPISLAQPNHSQSFQLHTQPVLPTKSS